MLSHRYEGPLGLLYGAASLKPNQTAFYPKNVWVEAEKLGKMDPVHVRFYP